jgi:Zn-dependent protease with chaperone function
MIRTGGTIIVTGILALAPASSMDWHAWDAPEAEVRIVTTDTLRDVAVAVYDAAHPTIYVNELRMQQFEPPLREFFMAHEYGHIRLRHDRSYALKGVPDGRNRTIQARELEADCWAAATLGRTDRVAVLFASRFFAEMGPFRFDREHPAGSQRAATILSCLPAAEAPRQP